jgi:hypothetical protein
MTSNMHLFKANNDAKPTYVEENVLRKHEGRRRKTTRLKNYNTHGERGQQVHRSVQLEAQTNVMIW